MSRHRTEDTAVTARVLFRFPLSLWAERNGHGTFESGGTDGSVVRTFELHQVEPFLRWLLSLEGEVEVLEPVDLRDELMRVADAVARAYGADE